MSARITRMLLLIMGIANMPVAIAANQPPVTPLSAAMIAQELGWVPSSDTNCGGYYLDQPFDYATGDANRDTVSLTGSQALFSQHGTTVLEGKVSLVRFGQQVTANKGLLYRDPNTGKLSSVELLGNVHLREPNTLVIAKHGTYDFKTNNKTLMDIVYRTSLLNGKQIAGPNVEKSKIQQERVVTGSTAWGTAGEFAQTEPQIYDMYRTSFSTCPPINPAWRVKASHIILNKNTGRGHAINARIYVKSVPVFYMPYFNFSIDNQRKSGFLWPSFGISTPSTKTYSGMGMYFLTPYYWNMAPNYDMTITPGILVQRGFRITDKFRYLNTLGHGAVNIGVLPNDRLFQTFQEYAANQYGGSTNINTQADLSRLENASTTRKSFAWNDDTHFNEHWSTHVDFSYAGDDYYLRDFGGSLTEVTQNQLLQEGDLYYKSDHYNFIGRLQAYQTLHPVDESVFENQYRRVPQLILNVQYPNQALGLEYFLNTEATHFDIRDTPGAIGTDPLANRFHLQPGISLPLYWPYFYINPRAQVSMTSYNLYETQTISKPSSAQRTIPIFDMAMGLALSRNVTLFKNMYQQTLEPQLYYTYIPYRNQASIPIFDTTVNTLTYDQIFNYNRFSNIDRIGDANQLGFGISTTFLDSETGFQKIRAGIGDIVYFSRRRVTLCNMSGECVDNPYNPANHWRLSPISGLINYGVNPAWNLESNALFNPISKQLGNASVGLHYKPDEKHLLNLSYGYVFNQDPLSGSVVTSAQDNLKLTDFSFSWPVTEDLSAVGRWSQNWNQQHLQNLLYGLQYDTCCWAVRLVGGRAFIGLNPNQNNIPQYNNEFFIQFALKGLGNIGSGNPSGLLSSINGYNTQFGQDF